MNVVRFVILPFVLFLAIGLTGCGKKDEQPAGKPKDAHEHDQHAAPHGGELVELAGGTVHVEFVHSESAGTLMVHVLDGSMKPLKITEAPVLNLKAAGGPKQITGVAAAGGTAGASEWSFKDDALKAHPEGASLRVTIAGKTYSPELPHEHH